MKAMITADVLPPDDVAYADVAFLVPITLDSGIHARIVQIPFTVDDLEPYCDRYADTLQKPFRVKKLTLPDRA